MELLEKAPYYSIETGFRIGIVTDDVEAIGIIIIGLKLGLKVVQQICFANTLGTFDQKYLGSMIPLERLDARNDQLFCCCFLMGVIRRFACWRKGVSCDPILFVEFFSLFGPTFGGTCFQPVT